jgi:hypothetical protein
LKIIVIKNYKKAGSLAIKTYFGENAELFPVVRLDFCETYRYADKPFLNQVTVFHT